MMVTKFQSCGSNICCFIGEKPSRKHFEKTNKNKLKNLPVKMKGEKKKKKGISSHSLQHVYFAAMILEGKSLMQDNIMLQG